MINPALLELSRILSAATVYRGVAGEADSSHENSGSLPSSTPRRGEVRVHDHNLRPEHGDGLSRFQRRPLGQGLEIKFGVVDRGANLSRLSRYSYGAEICVGPLTGLKMIGTRVKGAVLMVRVRLNVNLASLTIEQVVTRRRKMLSEMVVNLEAEMSRFLLGDSVKRLGTIPEQDANTGREFGGSRLSGGGGRSPVDRKNPSTTIRF